VANPTDVSEPQKDKPGYYLDLNADASLQTLTNFRISGFTYSVYCPVLYRSENTMLRKPHLFPCTGEDTLLGPSERVNLNHSRQYPLSPEDGNKSSFGNVVFPKLFESKKNSNLRC
jgi:hypothetical protein